MGPQIALIMALLAAVLDPTKDPTKRVLKNLQGTWVLVGAEEKGRVLTEEDVRSERESLVIKGDTITVRRGKYKETDTMRLDPTKKPAWIDVIDRKNKGKVIHAIYALDGDRFTICVSRKFGPNTEAERPIRFTTKPEDNKDLPGLVIGVYKRQKK